ncbi:hypothetical protein GOL49_32035 [Sinorhizobium medicae]|nr:hypothetical protein [Sinorhizobium medicae]
MDLDITVILHAVDALFDRELDFLLELARHPSARGQEQSAQGFIARELGGLGYEVDSWQIDVADISGLPGFSPVIGDYDNAVGTLRSRSKRAGAEAIHGFNERVDLACLRRITQSTTLFIADWCGLKDV